MPEVAKKATLDLAQKKLFIDGEEFPWHISEEGPRLTPDTASFGHCITLTFYAHNIEVIPAKTTAVLEAEMKVEHAQRALADAHLSVQDATERARDAQEQLRRAEDEAKKRIDWTKNEDGE